MQSSRTVIDNNKLDEVEKNLSDDDKQAFDAVAHKYKWGIIVGALIFTLISLMSFFGFVSHFDFGTFKRLILNFHAALLAQLFGTVAW